MDKRAIIAQYNRVGSYIVVVIAVLIAVIALVNRESIGTFVGSVGTAFFLLSLEMGLNKNETRVMHMILGLACALVSFRFAIH